MERIQDLITILESQYALYQDMLEVLKSERESITKWEIDKTIELAKSKDTLLYKEKLLDEARNKLMKKIQHDTNHNSSTLRELADRIEDSETKEKLRTLRKDLIHITNEIQSENISIKMLYNTNLKLISDFFEKIGLSESGVYMPGGMGTKKAASFSRSA